MTRIANLLVSVVACSAVLGGCATLHPPAKMAGAVEPWDQRAATLGKQNTWQLNGRAAAALGQQGWQASLDWRQHGDASDVHLAGPFGAGSTMLSLTPAGLVVNGAPATDAVLAQMQERLGFELPLGHLRYWLLGIPDPGAPFELQRNQDDRALHIVQDGWNIDYDKYLPNAGDVLPGRLVLTRADARVRIAIDTWKDVP